jgi:hypothetical protein
MDSVLRRAAENDRKVDAGQMTLAQSREDITAFARDGAPADTAEKLGKWFERTPSEGDEPV